MHSRKNVFGSSSLCPSSLTEPVTSLSFTADSSLLLVSTLDSTHRLLDLQHGTVVQSFTGHKNTNYRSQSCFGAREETVICGDEDGKVFGWDMEAVSFPLFSACGIGAAQRWQTSPLRSIRLPPCRAVLLTLFSTLSTGDDPRQAL